MLRALFKVTRGTEAGSALLLAVLVSSLLATAATVSVAVTRNARALSGESVRLQRARLEAQSMLAEAVVTLDAGERITGDTTPVVSRPDGALVTRQDAAGLLDINAARPDQIAAVLRANSFTADLADTLADRIADWRDPDDLRRLHGAEKQEYKDAHRPPPGNRAFVVETEIASVLGFDAAMARCLAPYFTTYSGADVIDERSAPQFLLTALSLPAPPPTSVPDTPVGAVVILTADAPISPQAVLQQRLWVQLTGDASTPFVVRRAEEELEPRRTAAAVACARLAEVRT